jgi:formylglycine-generating enzyme required for sulfatase activity
LVRLASVELEIGSTPIEVQEALADCAREALGDRCNETTFENELPTQRVRVAPFYMQRTEVTVQDYDRCVEVGACTTAGYAARPRYRLPNFPATFVTFDQATAYCRFRGLRLPTEAEFERAARGASRRRYPWGQLYNSRVANHGRLGLDPGDDSDGFAGLAPVGSFLPGRTPEGILDLAGNVAEWVEGTYRHASGVALSGVRVLRGGSYLSAAPWLRGAAREPREREFSGPYVGFRCARSVRKAAAPQASSPS